MLAYTLAHRTQQEKTNLNVHSQREGTDIRQIEESRWQIREKGKYEIEDIPADLRVHLPMVLNNY
jgi:hypothetical protein